MGSALTNLNFDNRRAAAIARGTFPIIDVQGILKEPRLPSASTYVCALVPPAAMAAFNSWIIASCSVLISLDFQGVSWLQRIEPT